MNLDMRIVIRMPFADRSRSGGGIAFPSDPLAWADRLKNGAGGPDLVIRTNAGLGNPLVSFSFEEFAQDCLVDQSTVLEEGTAFGMYLTREKLMELREAIDVVLKYGGWGRDEPMDQPPAEVGGENDPA